MGRALTDTAQPRGEVRSDSELVTASLAGNKLAFTTLVERYQMLVCSVAYAVTGSFLQSEEIGQETFVIAWAHLSALREPDRFRNWLCTIARNLGRKYATPDPHQVTATPGPAAGRKETALGAATTIPAEVPSPDPSPLDRIISREEEVVLWQALQQIPESYRLPLVLFYQEQKSVKRVAEMLDVSEDTVKTRLARGRRMLRSNVTNTLEAVLASPIPRKEFTAAVVAALALAATGSASAADRAARIARRAARRTSPWALTALAVLPLVVGLFIAAKARAPASAGRPGSAVSAEQRLLQKALPAWAAVARDRTSDPPGSAAVVPPASPRPAAPPTMAFDFESGTVPAGMTYGFVMQGPPRAGSRFCAVSAWKFHPPGSYQTIQIGGAVGLTSIFHHTKESRLSFDYWLPEDAPSLSVFISNYDRANGYGHVFAGRPQAWNHAEVPFADFKSESTRGVPMEEGDAIRHLRFVAGSIGSKPFYVDNIVVTGSVPADPLAPVE